MAFRSDRRQTGVVARVIDSNLNAWEDFAGLDINIPATYAYADGQAPYEYEQAHWSYRGQAAMCRLANGSIVRVRLGDWTNTAERRIQRQIITDPTDPSQWLAWTWLSYGDNYAVAIEADGAVAAGYHIYHAKANGFYRDNVLLTAIPNIIRIKPVFGKLGMLYFATVGQDIDGDRFIRWRYTHDANLLGVLPFSPVDIADYRWYHADLVALQGAPGYYYRFRAMPHNGGAREHFASDTLTCDWSTGPLDDPGYNEWNNARFLKGPSARNGFKRIDNLYITSLADNQFSNGAYYLFYNERHMDAYGNTLSNLKNPLFWSRSVGYPYYLTAPVPVGFSIWGFAGVVEADGYVYLAGNGRVLRRPVEATVIDITDNVITTGYQLPRDNQPGAGKLLCANPRNILGAQLGLDSTHDAGGLTDRRLELAIGLKRASDPGYRFKRDASWWISSLRKVTDGDKRQVEIGLGDQWYRLDNVFRDEWSIPGHFEYTDWQPDAPNQLHDWQNANDEFTSYTPPDVPESTVPRLRTVASGTGPLFGGTITLYAGWRGENGSVRAKSWVEYPDTEILGFGIVFRYIDASNFYLVEVTNERTRLHRVKGGVDTLLAISHTGAGSGGADVTVDFRWAWLRVTVNGVVTLQLDGLTDVGHLISEPEPWSGFVGLFASSLIEVSNFTLTDSHASVTTKELAKMLLAYIDEHEIVFEDDEDTLSVPQIDFLMGPQYDLNTPAKALHLLLDSNNLQVVWLEDT